MMLAALAIAESTDVGSKLSDMAHEGSEKAEDALDESMGWLYDNTWAIGIIYVVFGPLIAFFGGKWFPYITATLVGLFTLTVLC